MREKTERKPDIHLIGGDQIFFCDTLDGQYFRMVANDSDVNKISYAASANWSIAEASDIWKQNSKEILGSYKAISVREKKGVAILEKLLPEKTVVRVADPVFLLEQNEYLSLLSKKKIFKKPTLFCYLLHCDSETLHLDILQEVAEKLNVELKILGIQGTQSHLTEKNGLCLSPLDFLKAFRDAAYVLTNSFHGTVFSAVFQKKWVTVSQGTKNSIRQVEFLEQIQAYSQFVPFLPSEIIVGLQQELDWNSINKNIKDFNEFSKDWLLNSISSSIQDNNI